MREHDVALFRLVRDAQAKERASSKAWSAILQHMREEVQCALDPEKAKTVKGPGWAPYFYIRALDGSVRVCVEIQPSMAPYPFLFRVRLETGKGGKPSYRLAQDFEGIRLSFKAVTRLFEQQHVEGE